MSDNAALTQNQSGFYIIREGEKIFLTQEELNDAYKVQRLNDYKDDILYILKFKFSVKGFESFAKPENIISIIEKDTDFMNKAAEEIFDYYNEDEYGKDDRIHQLLNQRLSEFQVPLSREELDNLVKDKNIKLSNILIDQVHDLSYLFDSSDREDFSGLEFWDVSNVESMQSMFADSKFTYFNLIKDWDVKNCDQFECMFLGTKVDGDFSNWKIKDSAKTGCMFQNTSMSKDNLIKTGKDWEYDPRKIECLITEEPYLPKDYNENPRICVELPNGDDSPSHDLPALFNKQDIKNFNNNYKLNAEYTDDQIRELIKESTAYELADFYDYYVDTFIRYKQGKQENNLLTGDAVLFEERKTIKDYDEDKLYIHFVNSNEYKEISSIQVKNFCLNHLHDFKECLNTAHNSVFDYLLDQVDNGVFLSNLELSALKNYDLEIYKDALDYQTQEYRPSNRNELVNLINHHNIDLQHIDTSLITDMSYLFAGVNSDFPEGIKAANRLDNGISVWDVSNVKNMKCMFLYNEECGDIDFSKWDVSNVENMNSMFECTFDQGANETIKNWNTSNVTNMAYMFGTADLAPHVVDNWNVEKCQTFEGMFYEDSCNEDLMEFNQDLSNWNISKTASCQLMLEGNVLSSLEVLPNLTEAQTKELIGPYSYLLKEDYEKDKAEDNFQNEENIIKSDCEISHDENKYPGGQIQYNEYDLCTTGLTDFAIKAMNENPSVIDEIVWKKAREYDDVPNLENIHNDVVFKAIEDYICKNHPEIECKYEVNAAASYFNVKSKEHPELDEKELYCEEDLNEFLETLKQVEEQIKTDSLENSNDQEFKM